jgi:iron complex transport system ATP-binding protein
MLTLTNVCAGYSGTDVVRNISLRMKCHENLSIIGPNGCGKTTLLKTMIRLLPFRGEIKLGGQSLHKMKHKDISRKIAMLSQMSGIYFSYTVFDTVMMGRYLHVKDKFLGLPSDEDREFVTQCLKAVDLLGEKDREITKLSGGQLQRVFLARTLAQDPEIILLDEPTHHLDLKYQYELLEYLKEWSSQGNRAIVGVLHDLSLAMRLGGKIMVMKDGESRAYGKIRDVVTGSLLESVYDMDVAGYMVDSLKMWERLKS